MILRHVSQCSNFQPRITREHLEISRDISDGHNSNGGRNSHWYSVSGDQRRCYIEVGNLPQKIIQPQIPTATADTPFLPCTLVLCITKITHAHFPVSHLQILSEFIYPIQNMIHYNKNASLVSMRRVFISYKTNKAGVSHPQKELELNQLTQFFS